MPETGRFHYSNLNCDLDILLSLLTHHFVITVMTLILVLKFDPDLLRFC